MGEVYSQCSLSNIFIKCGMSSLSQWSTNSPITDSIQCILLQNINVITTICCLLFLSDTSQLDGVSEVDPLIAQGLIVQKHSALKPGEYWPLLQNISCSC